MGVRCPKYVTKQVTISSVWAIQVGTELVIRHVPDHIQILTRRWLILQRRPLQIKLPSVLKLATLFVANEQTTLFIESIVRYLFNVSWMHCSFDWKTYSMTSTDFESQQLTNSYILIKSGIKTQVHVDCQATPYLSVNLNGHFWCILLATKPICDISQFPDEPTHMINSDFCQMITHRSLTFTNIIGTWYKDEEKILKNFKQNKYKKKLTDKYIYL